MKGKTTASHGKRRKQFGETMPRPRDCLPAVAFCSILMNACTGGACFRLSTTENPVRPSLNPFGPCGNATKCVFLCLDSKNPWQNPRVQRRWPYWPRFLSYQSICEGQNLRFRWRRWDVHGYERKRIDVLGIDGPGDVWCESRKCSPHWSSD